jgi:hypothetical protein
MLSRFFLIVFQISIFTSAAGAWKGASAQPCLSYYPAVVKLTGFIKEVKLPNPRGQLDKFLVLHLTKPVCIMADSNMDAESNVKEIKLLDLFHGKESDFEYTRWKKLSRSHIKVSVEGYLYHVDKNVSLEGIDVKEFK